MAVTTGADSSLATYVKWVKNYTPMTNKINKKITIHHQAGNHSPEALANMFNGDRQASSNYGISSDGVISQMVHEKDRAWTSGGKATKYVKYPNQGPDNDRQAVTIEVANCKFEPNWEISDKAYKALIDLCADICIRNKITPSYDGTNNATFTEHQMFAATACPGPYIHSKMDQIVADVKIRMQELGKPAAEPKPSSIKPTSIFDEKKTWDHIMSYIGNAYGVAGLMGNLYAESGLRSNNLQNSYETKFGFNDEAYTEAVDSKKYNNFVKDSAGYGLAQWTFWSRKQNLLNYATQKGTSIGDLQMQLEYLQIELAGYKTVLEGLKKAKSVKEASDIVLTQFEKPADQSDNVKNKRAAYGQTYYDKYAKGVQPTPQPQPTTSVPFKVRVSIDNLSIRKGAGTNTARVGYTGKGVFTIVEVKSGTGSKAGWGKLKSGAGWISLDYATRI